MCSGCGRTYELRDGIVVFDEAHRHEDYGEEFHALLDRFVRTHFWSRVRDRAIIASLRDSIGTLRGRAILDVGCGVGSLLAALDREGALSYGFDSSFEALTFARRRTRGTLVCGSPDQVPFRDDFDAVTVCDVLEHVDDAVGFLSGAALAARPGAAIVIVVPAGPDLWSMVDIASGHKRRYTATSLAEVVRSAGLVIEGLRSFNRLLVPLYRVQRWWLGSRSGSPGLVTRALAVPPGPLNAVLHWVLSLDEAIPGIPIANGTSLILRARRSS